MRRFAPRTLASQVVALVLVVVAAIVVIGSALALWDARHSGDRSAREQERALAVALAASPSTAQALKTDDPTAILQPMTEAIRADTGIAFITIMAPDGERFTHTNPDKIGQRYLGSTAEALDGRIHTETYTGTLGPSVRTIAPVRDADGRIVGMVSVGVTEHTLTAQWLARLPLIAAIAASALATAAIGLWWVRRRILQATGGLAPRELRLMYEHHDAVLHSIKEGVIVVRDGRPALVNDEARRLLDDDGTGFTPDHVPASFLGTEPLDDVLYAGGGRMLLVNKAAVDGDRGAAVITLRDQTELAEATGELDSMTHFAEALRSQAHESANRMHTIVALIEMGRGEEATRLATTDLALSQHLVDRMSQSIAEPALAAMLLGKTAQAAERGIELTVTEDTELGDNVAGWLSAQDMVTIVGNLVDNALDACDPSDPWVEVTIVGGDDGVHIEVADSGPGMDPDVFARAQERGFSTKSGGDERGRGLGLALVAQVLRRHNGALTAHATYGSVVVAQIPATGTGPPRDGSAGSGNEGAGGERV